MAVNNCQLAFHILYLLGGNKQLGIIDYKAYFTVDFSVS